MPDRFVREGLLRSQAFNDCSFDAQLLYVRLLLVVDDFGCFDGRPGVVATQCYPTMSLDQMPDTAQLLDQLHRQGLIVRYSNRGKAFLAITQWRCDLRWSRRFPAPPVDTNMPGRTVGGKFGKTVEWRNPIGFDHVSILLDINGRAAAPQPDEWRGADDIPDWAVRHGPVTRQGPRGRARAAGATLHGPAAATTTAQDADIQGRVDPGHGGMGERVNGLKGERVNGDDVVVADVATTDRPVLQGPGNGKSIAFDAIRGEFVGLSEDQRLRWQGMFDDMSIPDQIERAAAWLHANGAERAAIERDGGGFEAFIVRWLLREARPH